MEKAKKIAGSADSTLNKLKGKVYSNKIAKTTDEMYNNIVKG